MDKSVLNVVRKIQDRIIIEAALQSDKAVRQSIAHQKFNSLLSDSFISESKYFDLNPEVHLPAIFTNLDLNKLKSNQLFIDPTLTGNSVALLDYIHYWTIFTFLQLHPRDINRARFLINRALDSAFKKYQCTELLDFIDRLWINRWILDVSYCASLKISISNKYKNIANQELSIEKSELYNSVFSKLSKLKESAENLDDWIEGLYCQLPNIKYAQLLLEESPSKESDTKVIKLKEILVNIVELFSCVHSSKFYQCINTPWSHNFLALVNKKIANSNQKEKTNCSGNQVQKSIANLLPKFWIETANLIPKHIEDFPKTLDEYNAKHLVSILISLNLERDQSDVFQKNKLPFFKRINFNNMILLIGIIQERLITTPISATRAFLANSSIRISSFFSKKFYYEKQTTLKFPIKFSSFRLYDVNEYEDKRLGVAINYITNSNFKLSIYIYDFGIKNIENSIDSTAIIEQYNSMKSDIFTNLSKDKSHNVNLVEETVEKFDTRNRSITFRMANFDLISILDGNASLKSYAILFVYEGFFIKVRITYPNNIKEAEKLKKIVFQQLGQIL